MSCQCCGLVAATKPVVFHQNIGMLVARTSKKLEASICRSCIHKRFWSMTLVTLGVGWLGTISIVLAPIFILNNVYYYVAAFCTAWPAPPELTQDVLRRIAPHVDELMSRLHVGSPPDQVFADVAVAAGTTTDNVRLFVREVERREGARGGRRT